MASLESALEEERLEILKLLESQSQQRRSPQQAQSTPSSPRQGYLSMVRTASPQRHVASMIDAVEDAPPRSKTPTLGGSRSGHYDSNNSNGIHRTRSDASSQPPRSFGPRSPMGPGSGYDFSMFPSITGGPTAKVGGPTVKKKRTSSQPQMYEPTGLFPHRSRSPLATPAFNHHGRAPSPLGVAGRVASPPPEQHRIMNEKGQMIDLDYAYAKLSDDALRRSGGALAMLPERRPMTDKQGESVLAGTGESLTMDGGVRLQKDVDSDTRAAGDSSSDDDSSDEDSSNSDEEDRGRPGSRGMITNSLIDSPSEPGSRANSSDRDDRGGGKKKKKKNKKQKRKTMSLLAAAEEERKAVSSSQKSKYKVSSLLPQISITPTPSTQPGATSPTITRRSGVHPSTNFDLPSQTSTPVSSDQEADDLDIRRAQKMETSISPIMSSPDTHRVVRTILRGDHDESVQQAAAKNKRTRKYLVATDLSSEAQYAMEWTIGTVLRDGDTLLAICAVDHDAIEDGAKTVSESSIGEALWEVSKQAQATASGSMTPTAMGSSTPGTSTPLGLDGGLDKNRERTKAERERYVACEAITGLVTKLLKKTRLQVKVIIEVIHCKSSKHLLTEIIDLVEPTLVILGSRGRSALKGVLLGSFSNYLVAKSSVPVMVARKKLKHTKKYSQTNIRLTNNLTSNTARILANAKVD